MIKHEKIFGGDKMDKRIKMAAGAGVAALALVVAGGGYYHFHVSNDTPEFAIKTIQQSVEDHDAKTFYRFVDVDKVLDSSYEGLVEGLTSMETLSSPDAKETLKEFTQVLRGPLLLTLKAAIDSYVATGDLKAEENIGVVELLERTGLNDAEVRDVKNIQINDANKNEAFADVILFQPELNKEFPLQLILARGKDGQWQVVRVQNFREYVEDVMAARQANINDYLAKAGEINARHEAKVREAEQKYGMILTVGSLSQKKTRDELKALIDDEFKEDWEERKQELFSLPVPKDAQALHNLYMRICDLAIESANDYSKWMDDNNAATIKSAEEKIHQVQALMEDAAALAKRMAS